MRPFAPLFSTLGNPRDVIPRDLTPQYGDKVTFLSKDRRRKTKTKCPRLATFLIPREYGTAYRGCSARREGREHSTLKR
jgi:hypothetical protein